MSAKVFDFGSRKLQTRECHEGKCNACGYEWVAPMIGACPKCGSDNTTTGKRKHFDYARVR